jgi:hypothetical protein
MSPDARASVPAPKGREFTKQYPLLVNVGRINNKWNIQPSTTATFPRDGKLYSDKMLERVDALGRSSLKGIFHGRGVKGGLTAPKFIKDRRHIPIVVRPGEYVRFQGDHSFFILAGRDQNVLPDPDSPDSPFVWRASQRSVLQSTQKPSYSVIGVAKRNLHQQRFYKCVAWVTVDNEIHLIDPDTVGTTDGGS